MYQGVVIRPPSEANSLIVQATLGCSDNGCTFCPAYKDKAFKIRNIEEIERDFKYLSGIYPDSRRIFLADGDAIIIEQKKLIEILDLANKYFPKLSRIAVYGSIRSLKSKSVEDLKILKSKKLGILYLGFETGDEVVYQSINKHGNPEENVETCIKVKESGIKINVTVILGLGGKKYSDQHAVNTAKILNRSKPDQIAALTLMIAPNTKLHNMLEKKMFDELHDFDFVKELYTLVNNMEDFKCLFFANHASNYYPIEARFPADKQKVLANLSKIIKINNVGNLKPEFMRGL